MTAKKQSVGKPEHTPRWVPIAGALVAIAALVWAIVSFFLKPESAVRTPTVEQKAQATGGTAINAAGHAHVVDGAEAPSGSTQPPTSEPGSAIKQDANAGNRGVAVNATDSADVRIKNQ